MKAVVYKKEVPDKLDYCDIDKPVIDRRYPLDKAADAMNYLKQGHSSGKVVINIEQN